MLPEVSILCISMLDGHSEKFLKHLLPQSRTFAWIMVSKMSLNRVLLIILIFEVRKGLPFKTDPSLGGDRTSHLWDDNIFLINLIAPRLRIILEDNKIRSSEMEIRDKIKGRGEEWSDNQDLDVTVEEIKNRLTKDALVDKNEKLCKKPVMLVLDNDIQMFPIENMPLLIKKEIYRMPSVGDWSKSRDAPETLGVDTLSELGEELKKRDLFVYLGHGDGRKLIQAEEIRKMDSCGAVFLIGCSSGYINYSKSSVPDGAPLDYLLGNSPAIVANMWVVTTGCMNLFTTELLQALIDTKLAEVVDCDQAAHEKVDDNKNPNKRMAEDEDNGSTGLCVHKRNLGSSFIKAREIAGRIKSYKDIAATVVYGVPVYITGNNVNK
ncbi:separase isoform X1 [Tanacetum coccineum]